MKINMLVIVAFSFLIAAWSLPVKQTLNYESIFNFGDSLSDTGNFLISGDVNSPSIGRPPFGQTFFNRSTGRCSDGRLIIDFIAEANGLPYVIPYLQSVRTNYSVDFNKGANFAVAGATANDFNFLKERVLSVTLLTNKTLDVQLDWFKKLKPSLCKTKPDCDQYFKKSLFFVGEIGGNDYNYPLLAFRSYKHAIDLVPFVVNKIINVTSALIEEGAVTLVVPGNLPIGCSAVLLERFSDDNRWLYDQRNHCFKPLNNIAKLHNDKLQEGLVTLRRKYTHAKISIYADYYGSAMQFFNSPSKYGFTGSVLKACCGGKYGRYNAKPNVKCGGMGSTTCENPSTYANWDGIHLTEAAYRHIATGLISGRFTKPSLSNNSLISKF
ncbi:LOW QUALITY PROTEIN: GDSL esterase/lipase At5g45910 [Raphanus sativus]|uniref:LOW QUALITY PROTEIN: GDSL esterase/lipase At5g45910 n=1 Tax=Raphanus sativus TaxID=3726 RepID=A0A9W3DLS2_RAPSA|nr:LOW QUALITY PROTEIN: GDSL esterase/lipase At5g45910 [Raphanus sativus]